MTKKVKIINSSPFELPKYARKGDSGVDLRADFTGCIEPKDFVLFGRIIIGNNPDGSINKIMLQNNARMVIPTNIKIKLPENHEAQIRPRSGLSLKKGLTVHFGTIDSFFVGNIGVIVANHTGEIIEIEHGERVAQLVMSKFETISWEQVEEIEETERGANGFGSTGEK